MSIFVMAKDSDSIIAFTAIFAVYFAFIHISVSNAAFTFHDKCSAIGKSALAYSMPYMYLNLNIFRRKLSQPNYSAYGKLHSCSYFHIRQRIYSYLNAPPVILQALSPCGKGGNAFFILKGAESPVSLSPAFYHL